MSKKNKSEEDALYAGIADGVSLRKHLLESSRDILSMLQSYEQFKHVREEKLELFDGLKADVKAISAAIGKVKKELPHIKQSELGEKKEKKVEVKEEKAEKVKSEEEKPKVQSAVEKLSTELDAIEAELSKLG